MRRLLLNLVVFLGSAAIGLLIAAVVLDNFPSPRRRHRRRGDLRRASTGAVQTHSEARVLGAVGLASTFVALLLTNLISSGLAIKEVGTWILATLIVWVVTMLATWALSRWIRPNRAAPHRIASLPLASWRIASTPLRDSD